MKKNKFMFYYKLPYFNSLFYLTAKNKIASSFLLMTSITTLFISDASLASRGNLEEEWTLEKIQRVVKEKNDPNQSKLLEELINDNVKDPNELVTVLDLNNIEDSKNNNSKVHPVSWEELDHEIKEAPIQLFQIRKTIEYSLSSLKDDLQVKSWIWLKNSSFAPKFTLLNDVKEFQITLVKLVEAANFSKEQKEHMTDILEEKVFKPVIKESDLLQVSWDQYFEKTKELITQEKQAEESEYDAQPLLEKITSFKSDVLDKYFPKSSQECGKLLLLKWEKSTSGNLKKRKLDEIKGFKEEEIIVKKPRLNPKISEILQTVLNEFENRKKILRGNESVMVFGKEVAPTHLKNMQTYEEELFETTSEKVALKELKEIKDFYLTLKNNKTLKLSNEEEKQMDKALDLTQDRVNSDTGLRPKAFLLETFGLLKEIYEKDPKSEQMSNLLTTAFYTFSDQNKSCVYGLLGRTFLIYHKIFEHQVDQKK
jgi:hypothetical protein